MWTQSPAAQATIPPPTSTISSADPGRDRNPDNVRWNKMDIRHDGGNALEWRYCGMPLELIDQSQKLIFLTSGCSRSEKKPARKSCLRSNADKKNESHFPQKVTR